MNQKKIPLWIWGIVCVGMVAIVMWVVRTGCGGGRQKTGAPASAPSEEEATAEATTDSAPEASGPVREISLAVRVKHVWLWQEGPGGKNWISGEEFVGDYVRQALLCQLPSSSESASIVAAMGTVRPQVHLEEKEADFILEVEGSYNFNTVMSSCELRGRFFRRADSLMVGQAVVEFPAPPPPQKGGRIAEGLILRGLMKKASLRLAEEIGGRFDSIPPPPPAEEKKPAEGTAAPPPKPSRSRGWLWGLLVGIAVGIAVGPTVQRWMASRRRPAAKEED